MTQTELQTFVSQTDNVTQNTTATETEDTEQSNSTPRDTVTLKYCGCTELKERTDGDNYYFPIQQFHEDIVKSVSEHNHSNSNVPPIESIEDLIDGDAIRPPDKDHSLVLTLAMDHKNGLTSNRQSIAYVGSLKYGYEKDGRGVQNRRTLSKDSNGELELPKKIISGPTTPSAVNVWTGDGTIAIEHAGFEATVKKRKYAETDYFLSVGVPGENKNSNYATSIEHKPQFDEYAIADHTQPTISYEIIANTEDESDIIGTIADASTQPESIDIKTPKSYSPSIDIGINEAIVRELGIEPDTVQIRYPNNEAPVVRLIPQHGEATDQYIIRRKSLNREIQIPAVNPEEIPGDNEYDKKTYAQFIRRAANDRGEPLGAREYDDWAKEQKKDEDNGRKNNGTHTTMGESRQWLTPDIHKISRESSYVDLCEAAGVTTRRRGKTKIEEQLEEIMDKLGITYIDQKDLPKHDARGNYTADVFVPEQDLVIEADGLFWHGHPKKYTPGEDTEYEYLLTDWIKHDRKRDANMKKSGYDVIRFWGDIIMDNTEKVQDKINEVIRNNAPFEHGKHPFGPEPRLE